MKKDNKGFSLVELIIVIAIMAVLIGLLAPQYMRFVARSKVSADMANAVNIADAYNATVAEKPVGYFPIGSTTFAAGDSPAPIVNGLEMFPESKVDKTYDWVVKIGSDGVEEITLGGDKIYPGASSQLAYYNSHYPQ